MRGGHPRGVCIPSSAHPLTRLRWLATLSRQGRGESRGARRQGGAWQALFDGDAALLRGHHRRGQIQNPLGGRCRQDAAGMNVRDQVALGIGVAGLGRYAMYADRLSAVASPGRSPINSTTTRGFEQRAEFIEHAHAAMANGERPAERPAAPWAPLPIAAARPALAPPRPPPTSRRRSPLAGRRPLGNARESRSGGLRLELRPSSGRCKYFGLVGRPAWRLRTGRSGRRTRRPKSRARSISACTASTAAA